jgi:hypothetical protein
MARALTTQETMLLTKRRRSVPVRVSIKDSTGAFQDFRTFQGRNWIRGVDYGEEVDAPVATATVRLWRDRYGLSLAPFMTGAKANLITGSYAPLVDAMREIKIETATLPEGVTPASGDWREVFRGFVDISKWAGVGKSVLELECRDGAGPLQEIVTEREGRPVGTPGTGAYGTDPSGRPVEEVMQDVLDDWATPGGYTVVLYTPTGTALDPRPVAERSGFLVTQFVPAKGQSVFETLTILANFIGYDVRWRWSDVTSEFRLEMFNPPRSNTTPTMTIGPGAYRQVTRLEVDPAPVRNVVRVTYQTDPADENTRTYTEDEDASSIARYRRRWMEIAEAASSAINTSTEAEMMRDAILADLKDPRADFSVDAEYRYDMQLNDLIRWSACPGHFDTDQDLAAIGIRHRIEDGGEATSSVVTRGRPCGKYTSWLHVAAAPGWGKGTVTWPGSSPTPTLTATVGGLIANIDAADMVDRDILHWEFHLDTAAGFTPSAATRIARGTMTRVEITGLSPATTYYCKVVSVRTDGVTATSSAASAGVPPSKLGSTLLADGSVKDQHVSAVAGDRIQGSKLLAGSGPLTKLDQSSGNLDNLTSITTRPIDSLTDSTYARPLAAALSSGKLKMDSGTAGLSGRMGGANLDTALVLDGSLRAGATAITPTPSDKIPYAYVWDCASTNLCKNPSFEVNVTDDWTAEANLTVTRDTTTYVWGDACAKVVTAAAGASLGFASGGAATGGSGTERWGVAVWGCSSVAGKSLQLGIQGWNGAAWVTIANGGWTTTTAWDRYSMVANVNAATYSLVRFRIFFGNNSATFFVDAAQLENFGVGALATREPSSYIDGTMGPGYAWTGTAHNSTSTRAAGVQAPGALNVGQNFGPLILLDDGTLRVGDRMAIGSDFGQLTIDGPSHGGPNNIAIGVGGPVAVVGGNCDITVTPGNGGSVNLNGPFKLGTLGTALLLSLEFYSIAPDPANITAGNGVTTTTTISGSHGATYAGCTMVTPDIAVHVHMKNAGWSAATTWRMRWANTGGVAVDPAATTVYVWTAG